MATEPAADAKAKPKSKLLLIVGIVVVLLVAGGGAAFMLLGRQQHGDDEEAAAPAAQHAAPAPSKEAPTFLALENMVINLADPGGDRFAQIGVTLQLADKKTEDRVKSYIPSIRSAVLLLISQRTAEELLKREGKEKLANDILVEASRPFGFAPPASAKEDDATAVKMARNPRNPVREVLFSSFIIQ